MNIRQKIIIWFGVIAIILMSLFPPWVHTFRSGRSSIYRAGEYGLIFSPPLPVDRWGVHLDLSRLMVQWIIIVVIVVTLIVLFKDGGDKISFQSIREWFKQIWRR